MTGYGNRTNKLHLFDMETVNETLTEEGISFDKTNIKENLTLILSEAQTAGSDLYDLPDYAVIQINDTHPTMVIPELIRLLTTEHGMEMATAIEVVSRTCAYTNHTILAEALETWPMDFFKEAVPQLIPIMEVLDDKVRRRFEDPSVYIIDKEDRVHMAHIDIHYGFSVNGVAALHTDILKETELNHFYRLYPEKFNNKTNGITFRRWLLHSNPELAGFITENIGDGYKRDASCLEALGAKKFTTDMKLLHRLLAIKKLKKQQLAAYLKKTQGMYLEIKRGKRPVTPITAIFGAKAAPAYTIAKDIIHLLLCLEQLTREDPKVRPYLRVVMVENYNVTAAEKLIPACDISQQISLASKEASGTSNMKFMLNGAVTLGTDDGANVEIHELVGDENIYIFGDSSETVIRRYQDVNYCSRAYYEADPELKEAVDFIVSSAMRSIGSPEHLERLYNELLNKDWFMTFPDFKAYCAAREQAYKDYENRTGWAQKMLVNISKAGFFSSDRTIMEYNRDIWKL